MFAFLYVKTNANIPSFFFQKFADVNIFAEIQS